MNCNDCVHIGDGESAGLSKVPFGTIMGENLVYDGGKNDQYVFGGMTICCIVAVVHNQFLNLIKQSLNL